MMGWLRARRRQTDYEVGDEDLEDLCFEGGAIGEYSLEEANKEVAHRRRDEGAVGRHFGNAGGEVMAMFAAVVGEPGGDEFL